MAAYKLFSRSAKRSIESSSAVIKNIGESKTAAKEVSKSGLSNTRSSSNKMLISCDCRYPFSSPPFTGIPRLSSAFTKAFPGSPFRTKIQKSRGSHGRVPIAVATGVCWASSSSICWAT